MFMQSKRKRCADWKLYVITDAKAAGGKSLKEVVRAAILGGADVIQLRDKEAPDTALIGEARALLEVTRPFGVPLIINDRAGVAKTVGAEGLHLGQADGSLSEARALL